MTLIEMNSFPELFIKTEFLKNSYFAITLTLLQKIPIALTIRIAEWRGVKPIRLCD